MIMNQIYILLDLVTINSIVSIKKLYEPINFELYFYTRM